MNKRTIKIDILVIAMLIAIIVLDVQLYMINRHVNQLETDTQIQMDEQSEKIVFVDSRVDLLSDSVDSSVADLQESIDTVSDDLATTRGVLHNTNYALIKTQKSVQEKEEEIQELREELKK